MTPLSPEARAEKIYYIAKYETESSIGIERIAAQIEEEVAQEEMKGVQSWE